MDAGFDPSRRLRQPRQFGAVLAARRALRAEHFVLNYAPRSGDDGPEIGARLGLVVGRKFMKKAVERNLVKRLARESFRTLRHKLPDLDLVLRLSAPLGGMERPGLRAELDALFNRLIR